MKIEHLEADTVLWCPVILEVAGKTGAKEVPAVVADDKFSDAFFLVHELEGLGIDDPQTRWRGSFRVFVRLVRAGYEEQTTVKVEAGLSGVEASAFRLDLGDED